MARSAQRQGQIVLCVCLVIGALVHWVVFAGDETTYVYARTVEQTFEEMGTAPSSRVIRVRGLLVAAR